MGTGQYIDCNCCAISEPAADFLGRCTALMVAAWKGHTLVVEQLIAAGAGLDVKDNDGYGPIYPSAPAVRCPSRQPTFSEGALRSSTLHTTVTRSW